jgi:uncharacterized membrane protein
VFAMLSNHYAITYTHPYNWAVLALIMLAGALIRQFFVMRHRGQVLWYLPLIGVALLLGAFAWTLPKAVPVAAIPAGSSALKLADIESIITQRCAQCHAAHPTMVGSAPAGVLLDSADAIALNAPRIYQQAVQLKAMPLGNVTHITDEERAKLGQWFTAGAQR